MHRGLHRGAIYACEGGDLVDREIAHAAFFNLSCDDEQDRPLTLRVVLPQTVRKCTRSTQFPAAVA